MSNKVLGAANQQGSLRQLADDPSETRAFFMNLTKTTEQLIIGTVLGDGHIRRNGRYYRLELTHSPEQKEYLEWKYRVLLKDNLVKSPPHLIMGGEDKKYPQWRCDTLTLLIFEKFRKMFYSDGKKRITRKALNRLEPLGLAVWYMDDGSVTVHKKKYSRELHLNTYSFYREQKIIQKYFKERWNISVRISRSKGNYRIALNAIEGKKLLHLIRPYIVDSMKYKLDLGYRKNFHNAELLQSFASQNLEG